MKIVLIRTVKETRLAFIANELQRRQRSLADTLWPRTAFNVYSGMFDEKCLVKSKINSGSKIFCYEALKSIPVGQNNLNYVQTFVISALATGLPENITSIQQKMHNVEDYFSPSQHEANDRKRDCYLSVSSRFLAIEFFLFLLPQQTILGEETRKL